MRAAALELSGLRKSFGDTAAVDGVDLEVAEGEFMTLLGPSGCGKTTVLRLVAGFERPDAGRVRFGGRDVTGWSPQRRGFGMVFQHYALFPHLTVFENVAFGLRARRMPRDVVAARVEASLARVSLDRLGGRRVQELSGGQQQRVALARALAIEPPLLLLDEPLSNLDAALRERTRTEVRTLVKELGISALYVTHDQEEAFDVSDRIAVMNRGRLRQVGTAEELYLEPRDRFVAGFVGRANAQRAVVEETPASGPARSEKTADGSWLFRLQGNTPWRVEPERVRLVGWGDPGVGRSGPAAGMAVELLARPEAFRIRPPEAAESAESLRGRLVDRRFRGPVTTYRVRLEGGLELEITGDPDRAEPEARVAVDVRPDARILVFPEERVP